MDRIDLLELDVGDWIEYSENGLEADDEKVLLNYVLSFIYM